MKFDLNHIGVGAFLLGACLLLLVSACQDQADNITSEFLLDPGLVIEQVAEEPLITAPVAMQEDMLGRIWVAEMTGYMRNIEGDDEDIPDGTIVVISDSDNDGIMDKRTVFLDSLVNPRAVSLVYGGLLYTSGTALLWTPIIDNSPGEITVVDSVYVIGGNIEHQPNGLLYNLDNWIYSAKSNARYKRVGNGWIKEVTSFRGQWGISMDTRGRLIYNHNSLPMAGDHTMPNVLLSNRYLELEESTNTRITDDLRIFPIQAVAVNRGYIDGQLDERGHVINTTSACAPHLFYGMGLGPEYYGRGFVCMPEGNLISTYEMENDGLEIGGVRVGDSSEFLVSREETFRPVNLATALDGSLFVLDMRKGIIQHRAYMSDYLHAKILERGLDRVSGKGRIYKVRAKDYKSSTPDFSQPAKLLEDPNLAVRMYAQREIVGMNSLELVPALQAIALSSKKEYGQVHALWTLEGLEELTADVLKDVGVQATSPFVLSSVLILLDNLEIDPGRFLDLFESARALGSRELDLLLAHIAGHDSPEMRAQWQSLASKYVDDPMVAEALVSGIEGREEAYLNIAKDGSLVQRLVREVLANRQKGQIVAPQLYTVPFEDNRTAGLKVFKKYCAACHGMNGKGQKEVAPSLGESVVFEGPVIGLAKVILEGYMPPSGDYLIPMPAYKNDPLMTNEAIRDLVSYLQSTFRTSWGPLSNAQIDSLRATD